MGTGIFHMEGKAGRDAKRITLTGRYDDPLQGPVYTQTVNTAVNQMQFLRAGILPIDGQVPILRHLPIGIYRDMSVLVVVSGANQRIQQME